MALTKPPGVVTVSWSSGSSLGLAPFQGENVQNHLARKALPVALAFTLAIAACGGDDKAASPGDSAVSTGPTTTIATAPFKVMVIGDLTSSALAYTNPEIGPAAKAALAGLPNAQVEVCDSKGDAGSNQQCQQKAVSEGVAAVIQGFGAGAQDQKILTDAKIPDLGDSDTTSANSYAVTSAFALYAANGIGLAKAGCKKLGILYLEGSDALVDNVRDGAKSAGATEVARAAIPANAPDLSPAVSRLVNAGAECIALSVVPTQVVQAVTAVRQAGANLPMGGVAAIFTKDVLKSLGDAANGLLVVDSDANGADTSVPGIAQLGRDMKAIDSGAELTQLAAISWVSGRLIAAAAASIQGPITAATMATALDGLKDVDTMGVTAPITVKTRSNPNYARLINGFGISYKIDGGKPKREGDFYDLSSVIGS
jgi:ABC-type branched-subunit amino acid transport system substrate-binding protein